MRLGTTYVITAPQILKGLRLIGVENGAQYVALADADIIQMMKGKGLNAYQRNYILRRKRWCRSEGWTVEFGDQEKQPTPPVILRDHFAATAMIEADISQEYAEKLLGRSMPNWMEDTVGNAEFWADFEARAKYIKADAMLKAREAK